MSVYKLKRYNARYIWGRYISGTTHLPHSYNARYIFSFVDGLLGCFRKVSFSLQSSTITLTNHQNIFLTGALINASPYYSGSRSSPLLAPPNYAPNQPASEWPSGSAPNLPEVLSEAPHPRIALN